MEETTVEQEELVEAVDFEALEKELTTLIENCEASGTWSVYVKDLGSDSTLTINNQSMYAASLIKLFVMEASFSKMDTLISNVCKNDGVSETAAEQTIMTTMSEMITVSDNESYNELVRLQSSEESFTEGCLAIDAFIQSQGYSDTAIYHTLNPSDTEFETTEKADNCTSAEDCGILLEAIYEGTCVSEEASEEMLNLLLEQEVNDKIPAGLSEDIKVANKTGETDECQHDVAIVFGEKTDYILCVMSSEVDGAGDAMETIQEISAAVYEYLNSGDIYENSNDEDIYEHSDSGDM